MMNELLNAGLGVFIGLALASIVAPLLVLFIELFTYKPIDYQELLKKQYEEQQAINKKYGLGR